MEKAKEEIFLAFNIRLPYRGTQRLIMGQLEAWRGTLIDFTAKATSGLAGYQYRGGQSIKGRGQIPPSVILKENYYQVHTEPIQLPAVKGVEGAFFRITPFNVTVNGRHRGDFGIHRDANVPGSAGCIVLPEAFAWLAFEGWMLGANKAGYKSLPLAVNYLMPK